MGYANPEIYYKGQKYSVGGNVGYRPAATGSVQVVKDLQFMSEVVERKRMSMSADELLHAMKMIVEVGPELVAEDGRPRGITGMIKFNRSFKGKLEAAKSRSIMSARRSRRTPCTARANA